MADTAFQTQYRQEFVAGFEQRKSLLADSVTTEVQVKGNSAVFLVADSGGAEAVTRGVNGRIPGRADDLTQLTCTLQEWHDKPERTGFNIFASQGDGKRIMQETSMAVLNRKIDQDILDALNTATNDTGSAQTASLRLALKAKTILGVNKVPNDGMLTAVVSPAYMAYLLEAPEFSSADFVTKRPIDTGEAAWSDNPGFYRWMGIRWIEHPEIPGVGTNAEKCFMYHRSAIGHAAPAQMLQTFVGYDEQDDFSYCRVTGYFGSKLLQNSGVVVMNHDGSAMVAT